MRRLTYRHAIYAFAFTGLWVVLGLLFLLTPLPDALGIAGQFISVWLVMIFITMGISGLLLTLAAVNGIFPPVARAPARAMSSRPAHSDAASKAWTQPVSPGLPSRPRDR